MKRKKASLVINPRAGENLAKINDILPIFAAAGWSTELALKEYGGQAMDLAASAATAGSDLVIAYGGDGTLNQVVNGVMHTSGQHSIVGLIPGGTANVWANEISVPGDPVKAALTLVDSEARKVDIGHVQVEGLTFPDAPQEQQGQNGKQKKQGKAKARSVRQHFLLLAGLGIDAAVMGHVSKPLKYQIGTLAVGVSAARELPAQHPFPVEIGASNEEILWKGEALQVIIGNTRSYANIVEMTSDAYIDDGILDVCVIIAGDVPSTMQQIASLLFRRKPDNLTTEYFHGAHLSITAPASIGLELDGSTVKLKDYLNKSDRKKVAQAGNPEQVMVTYRFDAMPRALEVAIPRTYNNKLFQESDSAGHDQQQTESAQAPAEQQSDQNSQQQKEKDEHSQEPWEAPEHVKELLEHGRKVTVVGAIPHPAKKDTYIVTGSTTKQSTGEAQPVAVCIDKRATVIKQTGESISPALLLKLKEGETFVVEGKKSKRGVLQAKHVVIM